MSQFITDQTFDKNDFKLLPLIKGEYENCVFRNCDFSGADLSGAVFLDCEFVSCNLSLVKLAKTAFRDVKFKDCKMLGLHFENCNDFGLAFSVDGCSLNHSSFYKRKLKNIILKNAQLQESDFTECDLTAAVFDNCDLTGATFDRTILEKADFRTSYNYSIDPEINQIKKAKFSLSQIAGLLTKYTIEIDRTL